MITIEMKTKGSVDHNSLLSINTLKVQGAMDSHNLANLNKKIPKENLREASPPPLSSQPASLPPTKRKQHPLPSFVKPTQKGQKVSLETSAPLHHIKACFGWNTTNPYCDADVSAFLLGSNGKVLGDSWFVFYGQPSSPDKSTIFQSPNTANAADLETITIDFDKLHPNVKKIVFVLTINEALEHHLHFGMMADAYIRILNSDTSKELVSFLMTDYYSNIISTMIGEIYFYNGVWKFHAVGNGVAKDLAGLCTLYGVQVEN